MNMKRYLMMLIALVALASGTKVMAADESYAVYNEGTLMFCHDSQRSSRTGTTYDLNTDTNKPGWYSDGNYADVEIVLFDPSFKSARPMSTCSWFHNMKKLVSIYGNNLNTSEVTVMDTMFFGCSSLTGLDLSSFDTSNVTNMYQMFYGCSSLTTVYVGSEWSTKYVPNSQSMFYDCSEIKGEQGTQYDANHTDAAYAHIDGGPSYPGYFTGVQGGVVTGVSEASPLNKKGEMSDDQSAPLYNLRGQRVSHPVKGQIYIQNRRKVKF